MLYDIIIANYLDRQHAQHIQQLMDIYAQDIMGGGQALSPEILSKLPKTLSQVHGAFSVLSYANDKPIGLINCFEGFSTFACQALINIHDIIVVPEYRGQGVCNTMLKKVEETAKQRNCCKLTLEVLSGNAAAKKSYTRHGFANYQLSELAGTAEFWQKTL